MKTGQNFGILYCLLVICQVLLCNYFQFTPYITLTILPAMILCIPLTISTIGCLIITFVTALATDWLAEGIIGLNAVALLPVAILRKPIIGLFIGEDLITRQDSFSFRKNGAAKVNAAILTSLTLFMILYIIFDGAGTRPLWFNLARGAASLACSWIMSIIAVNTLTPDDRK
jgi:hypothetical protein